MDPKDQEHSLGDANSGLRLAGNPPWWSFWGTGLLACLVLGVVALLFLGHFKDNGYPMDEGMLLVFPERILHGDVPHRDFLVPYPPGNFWVLAGAYALCRPGIKVERVVGLVYRLALVLGIFLLGRRFGRLAAAWCGLLSGLLLLPLSLPAFSWVGAMALLVWALWFLLAAMEAPSSEGRKLRLFLGGLLAGAVLLYRIDVAPACLLAAAPVLLRVRWLERWTWLLGAALGVLPLAIHIVIATPSAVFHSLIVDPIFLARAGRRLPLLENVDGKLVFLGLLFLSIVVPLVSGVIALRKNRSDPWGLTLLSIGLMALGISSQALQRADNDHFMYVGCVSVALLPLSIQLLRFPSNSVAWARCRTIAVTSLLLLLPIPGAGSLFQKVHDLLRQPNQPVTYWVSHDNRSFPLGKANDVTFLQNLAMDLDGLSVPGQRLFVGPRDMRWTNYNDLFLYHLFPRLVPATYFMEMDPGSANRPGSRLAADVASADVLILSSRYMGWKEPNASSQPGSDVPNQVVADQFRLFRSYGPFDVFVKRNLATHLAGKGPR